MHRSPPSFSQSTLLQNLVHGKFHPIKPTVGRASSQQSTQSIREIGVQWRSQRPIKWTRLSHPSDWLPSFIAGFFLFPFPLDRLVFLTFISPVHWATMKQLRVLEENELHLVPHVFSSRGN
ncbi:hypothetical protein TWF970_007941 [Orbilia oligospora]|uniref:Uncharacterized protein n=1 Tax=Orbilia oligospora TaxID=2813651 RepID=A0A7C8V4N9_ORBOL|nr:hypothetical protein TWF970_007941 [Orbilia oligospora]